MHPNQWPSSFLRPPADWIAERNYDYSSEEAESESMLISDDEGSDEINQNDIDEAEAEFAQLKVEYPHLFANAQIQEHRGRFPNMKSVNDDTFSIISGPKGKPLYLGALQVIANIAICARAVSKNSVTLGIFSVCIENPEYALEKIMQKFKKAGCAESEIEIFLVGGHPIYSTDLTEALLQLSAQFPIVGAKLNLIPPVEDGSSIDVVISHAGIFYGQGLFNN